MPFDFKEQYSRLWETVFKDGKTFIDKYFSVFLNNDTFYYTAKDNCLVSALLSCKYNWYWQNTLLNYAYISGVLTDNKFRGQGYASQLINNTLNSLYNKEIPLCGLITQNKGLINYYNKFGFAEITSSNSQYWEKITSNNETLSNYKLIPTDNITDSSYLKFFTYKNNSVSHNINTLSLYNDSFYNRLVLLYNDTAVGIAVTVKTPQYNEILYFDCIDTNSKSAMITLLGNHFNGNLTITKQENRMLRIVNAKKILEIYALNNPEKTLSLHIIDTVVQQNNITVEIKSGNVKETECNPNTVNISIESLTSKLFNGGRMFLMLDK